MRGSRLKLTICGETVAVCVARADRYAYVLGVEALLDCDVCLEGEE